MDTGRIARDNLIVETLGGSHAYGLAIETSDLDVRGVFVAPPSNLIGLFPFDRYKDPESDTEYWQVTKFLTHIYDGDCNTLGVVFGDPKFVRRSSDFWEFIQEHRKGFIAKEAAKEALGFIKNMRKRATNQIAKGTLNLTTANKQAMHGLRLGRIARDMLKTFEYRIYRPEERDLLLPIKRGEVPLEQVFDMYDDLVAEIDVLMETSPLQARADRATLDTIAKHVVLSYWEFQRWV